MPSIPAMVAVAPWLNCAYEASNAPDADVVTKPPETSCDT